MCDLLSPLKLKDQSFQELVLLMKNHFDPQPNEIVQRYKFDSRNHKPNETVREYVAELHRIVTMVTCCREGQDCLRHQCISESRRSLLSNLDLTFDKALSTAMSLETENANAQDLQTTGTTAKCFNTTKGQQETRRKGNSRDVIDVKEPSSQQ